MVSELPSSVMHTTFKFSRAQLALQGHTAPFWPLGWSGPLRYWGILRHRTLSTHTTKCRVWLCTNWRIWGTIPKDKLSRWSCPNPYISKTIADVGLFVRPKSQQFSLEQRVSLQAQLSSHWKIKCSIEIQFFWTTCLRPLGKGERVLLIQQLIQFVLCI